MSPSGGDKGGTMISHSAVVIKIQRERSRYGREFQTDFVKGIRFGLEGAIQAVKETVEETRAIRDAHRGKLNRWSAAQFRHAIIISLACLKRCDRGKAIRILEAAVEHEGEEDFSKRGDIHETEQRTV